MLGESIRSVLQAIKELRAAIDAMEARGDRVPFEMEEKLHLVEEKMAELVELAEQARKH